MVGKGVGRAGGRLPKAIVDEKKKQDQEKPVIRVMPQGPGTMSKCVRGREILLTGARHKMGGVVV